MGKPPINRHKRLEGPGARELGKTMEVPQTVVLGKTTFVAVER